MATRYRFGDSTIPHFITFSVIEWIDVFTREEYRKQFVESLDFCSKNKGLLLHGWVLMSNHVHLIASCTAGNNLAAVIRDLKKFTAKTIIAAIVDNPRESRRGWMEYHFKRAGMLNSNNKTYQFWQQDNHPIILDTNDRLQNCLDYVHNNPVRAGLVEESWHYLYSSAVDYGLERNGLAKLVLL